MPTRSVCDSQHPQNKLYCGTRCIIEKRPFIAITDTTVYIISSIKRFNFAFPKDALRNGNAM